MDDTAIRSKLDGITLLLMMAVSLLSGLVFGRGYDDRVGVAILSFVVVLVVLLGVSYVQSSSSS